MTKRASLSGAQMWNFVLQSEGEKRRGTILATQDCIFKVGPSLKSVFIENKTPLGTAATKIVGLDWLIKRNPLDRDFLSDRWRRKRQKSWRDKNLWDGKSFSSPAKLSQEPTELGYHWPSWRKALLKYIFGARQFFRWHLTWWHFTLNTRTGLFSWAVGTYEK